MNRRIIYLGWVAPGLRTPILQEEVGAQIVDDALHGPVLPRLGLEGARQALATTPAAEAGAKGLAMPGKEREGNDEEKGSVAQKMCHFEGCGVEPRISVRGDIFVESFQPAIDDHSAAVSTVGSKIVKPTGFTHCHNTMKKSGISSIIGTPLTCRVNCTRDTGRGCNFPILA